LYRADTFSGGNIHNTALYIDFLRAIKQMGVFYSKFSDRMQGMGKYIRRKAYFCDRFGNNRSQMMLTEQKAPPEG